MYHDVDWTPARTARFWNYLSSRKSDSTSYFSKLVGEIIVRITLRHVGISGTAVDIGCGPGHLLEPLLSRGIACKAVDPSEASIALVNRRFAEDRRFLGASVGTIDSIPLQSGEADVAFLIEVLEHVCPADVAKAFAELRRCIRPGGHVIITVPNREDLILGSVACPECGCVFHRVQHVQSFSADSLCALLEENGFRMVFGRAMDLRDHAGSWFRRLAVRVKHLVWSGRSAALPHLVVIGEHAGS